MEEIIKRIGNDIQLEWYIYVRDGETKEPFDFTDKEIKLYVQPEEKGSYAEEIKEYEIDGNILKFIYHGESQHHLGGYLTVLQVKDEDTGQFNTVDYKPAFRLVANSNQVDLNDVVIESFINEVGYRTYVDEKIAYVLGIEQFDVHELSSRIDDVYTYLNDEVARAEDAEANLYTYIQDETKRAQDVEASILGTLYAYDNRISYLEASTPIWIDQALSEAYAYVEAEVAKEKARAEGVEATKQDILVSGENIKTINGYSLVGSGNVELDITKPDLSSYVTYDYLSSQAYLQSVPEEYVDQAQLDLTLASYVTQAYLSSQSYLQSVPSEYAKKDDIPTNLSSFVNDAGYITTYIVPSQYLTDGELDTRLNPYAKKVDIPTKMSELVNNVGYITSIPSEYVTEQELVDKSYVKSSNFNTINGYSLFDPNGGHNIVISGGEVIDLSAYVKQSYLSAQGYLQAVPDEYVTQAEISAMSYLTEDKMKEEMAIELSSYAKKTDLGEYTKTTNFNTINGYALWTEGGGHDIIISGGETIDLSAYVKHEYLSAQGYLTEHQSLAAYPTYTYVDKYAEKTTLDSYAKKTELPTKVSQLENDAKYITTYVVPSQYLTDDELTSRLNPYAKKVDMPTKLSQLTNNVGYISSIPSNYVTDAKLDAKLADSAYVPKAEMKTVNGYALFAPGGGDIIIGGGGGTIDLSAYVKHTFLSAQGYLQSIPDEYITQAELSANAYIGASQVPGIVTPMLQPYATKADVSSMGYITKSVLDNELGAYATKQYITSQSYAQTTNLKTINGNSIVGQGDIHIEGGGIDPEILNAYVTHEYLSAQAYLTEHQSLDEFATKAELSSGLNTKQDKGNYALKTEIPTKVSQLTNDKGFITTYIVPSQYVTETEMASTLTPYAKKTDVPTKLSQLTNNVGYITTIPSNYVTDSKLDTKLQTYAQKTEIPTKVSQLTNDKGYISQIPSEYVTESEMNTALYPYAKKTELPTKTSQLTNDSGFITNSSLNNYATKTELSSGLNTKQDKGDYALKTDIPEIPRKVSYFENDVPYATFSQLNDGLLQKQDVLVSGYNISTVNGYSLLTGEDIHIEGGSIDPQILNNYVPKTYMNTINGYALWTQGGGHNIIIGDGGGVDLSAYVKKTELSAMAYTPKAQLNTINGYSLWSTDPHDIIIEGGEIDPSILNSYVKKVDLSAMGYASKDYLSSQGYLTSKNIGALGYVTQSYLSSQSYLTNAALEAIGYVTQAYLSEQSYVTSKALSALGYVTKDYLVTEGYVTKEYLTDTGYITQEELSANAYVKSYDFDRADVVTEKPTTYEPNRMYFVVNDEEYFLKTINGQSLIGKGNIDITIIKTTGVLLTGSWVNGTQTINVPDVTPTNLVTVAPAGNPQEYAKYGIYATAQGTDTLTFACITKPTTDITVNIVIQN